MQMAFGTSRMLEALPILRFTWIKAGASQILPFVTPQPGASPVVEINNMESTYEVFIPLLEETEKDLAIALLSEFGFSAFQESPGGLKAYCHESEWPVEDWKTLIEETLGLSPEEIIIKILPPVNYNAAWEAALEPVFIENLVQILPQGQTPQNGFSHTLFITPKMSFGTGHHPTTRLMIQEVTEEMVRGKQVLDLGSGTGILGILSAKMGASSIIGIDIEPWCTENATENAAINVVSDLCQFKTGTLDLIPETDTFPLIFANINRNILLDLKASLNRHLSEDGFLLLSGFFEEDVPLLKQAFETEGLIFSKMRVEDRWVCLVFHKTSKS